MSREKLYRFLLVFQKVVIVARIDFKGFISRQRYRGYMVGGIKIDTGHFRGVYQCVHSKVKSSKGMIFKMSKVNMGRHFF